MNISDNDVENAAVTFGGDDLTGTTLDAFDEGDKDGATYTVVLAAEPKGDVTITIKSDENVVMVSPSTPLTFTTENWDDTQDVTVKALNNDVDAANLAFTLSHEVEGGGYDAVTPGNITGTVNDDDVAAVMVTGLSGREVREGGTISYQVKLATQPSGGVSILASTAGHNATFNFDATNWNTAQSATITVPDDEDETTGSATAVSFTVAGYNAGDGSAVTQADVSFQVRDKGAAEVIVSLTDLSIAAGASDSYNLSLTKAPAAGETVTITVATAGQIGIAPTEVELNADNWENGVDVTLSPLASAAAATDVAVTNTGVAAGGGTDSVYSTAGAGGNVEATDLTVDITTDN